MNGSREQETELLYNLREYGSDTEILEYLLGWLDSDTTCEALSNLADEWDVPIE